MRAALEAFATQGGVVVVMKPIGDVDENDALALAGLADSQKQRKTTSIRVDGAAAPALLAFDSTRERVLPIAELDKPEPIDVFTYTVDPKAGTTELAHAFARAKPLGAVATRRPLGRGAIYAWGFDLQSYEVQPCYVNCFEPSGDLLRLFLRDALREGVGGHLVVKHTMPGPADSALLVTHDIDAPDAYSAGTWGGAGVTRMAEMENRHHVHATYNITTDYVAGYFRSKIIRELCQAGMCPVGGHSVQHLTTFDKLTRGTCKETKADYEAKKHPTLCGEIRVPLEMLTTLTGERPRVWRSPFLFVHPVQFDVLRSEGIQTDSSFGIGDLKYNLPVDAERAGVLQDIFHHAPIYEFPIVMEDGIGWIEHGEEKRRELQASNLTWFETGWEDALLGNAANGSLSTLLVHPSLGADVPDDNIELKINAVAWIIETAQAHKIPMDTLLHFGDFWRARAGVRVDASYDAQKGYQGVLEVGALPITDFTLEFGDALASFTCPGCGRIELHGKRSRRAPSFRSPPCLAPPSRPPPRAQATPAWRADQGCKSFWIAGLSRTGSNASSRAASPLRPGETAKSALSARSVPATSPRAATIVAMAYRASESLPLDTRRALRKAASALAAWVASSSESPRASQTSASALGCAVRNARRRLRPSSLRPIRSRAALPPTTASPLVASSDRALSYSASAFASSCPSASASPSTT
jgi:hypothetical protein